MVSPRKERSGWVRELFPAGVPRLWCPPLTHYTADGAIDRARAQAHLRFLARWSKGWLVPGSTGDGWELSSAETREVVDLAVSQAEALGACVLVGALDPDVGEAARTIAEARARLGAELGAGRVCGFAVCPPRGGHLTQEQLDAALSGLLGEDVPFALYQLPQVTQNEMSPALVQSLARRFPNLVLFKDTSGEDRVAMAAAASDVDLGGVFLVRGAEGGYVEYLKANAGPYDGFLLSTANSFGAQLHDIIALSSAGRLVEAGRLSRRVSAVVGEAFGLVAHLQEGNVFASAGKAVDHFFAYGPDALDAPAPRLHGGMSLSGDVLGETRDALARHDLLPARGYLE